MLLIQRRLRMDGVSFEEGKRKHKQYVNNTVILKVYESTIVFCCCDFSFPTLKNNYIYILAASLASRLAPTADGHVQGRFTPERKLACGRWTGTRARSARKETGLRPVGMYTGAFGFAPERQRERFYVIQKGDTSSIIHSCCFLPDCKPICRSAQMSTTYQPSHSENRIWSFGHRVQGKSRIPHIEQCSVKMSRCYAVVIYTYSVFTVYLYIVHRKAIRI